MAHNARRLPTRVRDECWTLWQLARAGGLSRAPLGGLCAIVRAMRDYGPIGAAVSMGALRYRDRVALLDERGPLTFADIEARSNAVANAWRSQGLRAGDGVGILVRNHRGFLDGLFAAAKSGARMVLLNTDFGGAQLADVVRREGVDLLVHDAEHAEAVDGIDVRLGTVMAWGDTPVAAAQFRRSAPRSVAHRERRQRLCPATVGTIQGSARGAVRGHAAPKPDRQGRQTPARHGSVGSISARTVRCGEGRRRGAAQCSGAGACGAGILSGLSCLCDRVLRDRRKHPLVGATASAAGAVGFLSARPTAVARVGATVERRSALPALQSPSGHNGMLQLSVTHSKFPRIRILT